MFWVDENVGDCETYHDNHNRIVLYRGKQGTFMRGSIVLYRGKQGTFHIENHTVIIKSKRHYFCNIGTKFRDQQMLPIDPLWDPMDS